MKNTPFWGESSQRYEIKEQAKFKIAQSTILRCDYSKKKKINYIERPTIVVYIVMVLVAVKAAVAVRAMAMMVVCAYHCIGHGVHSNSSNYNGSTDANDTICSSKGNDMYGSCNIYQCTMVVKAAKQHLCH
jgi:hypothetical protein